MSALVADRGDRPQGLRGGVLANNARLMALLAVLGMPLAIYILIIDSPLPVVLAGLLLVGGMFSLSFLQRRMEGAALQAQVMTFLSIGLMLSLVDARMVDAGVGIAAMTPILIALLDHDRLRRGGWILSGGVVVIAVSASLGPVAAIVPAMMTTGIMLEATNFTALIVTCLVLLHTATRVEQGRVDLDETQGNAYRHLLEHVQDSVIRFSSDGQMLMVSRSSERLFGCRHYEITAASFNERLHILDRPAFFTTFAKANRDGVGQVIQLRMRQDDPYAASNIPYYIWVELSFSPVLSAGAGGRHEVIAILRDVTDRKDQESAAEAARVAAEKSLIAKSRLLATVGHELRTPLNAVIGFSEMMLSGVGGKLNDAHREQVGLILQGGRHLLDVVTTMLDMARLEAGRFALRTETFALEDMVGPCFGMVGAMARTRNVTLLSDIAGPLPKLVGDERACRQILLNLLSNAVKFSHPGGQVMVSLKRQGQNLNLSVRDHGIGMAPETLSRIGTAFFQAQDGLDRQYEGTGLGLAIVKGLVELHEGTLRTMSEIGAGTVVTVLLPIKGPAIKSTETAAIAPFLKEPNAAPEPSWYEEKRKAQ